MSELQRRIEAARAGTNPTVIRRMASGWAVLADWQRLPGYIILLADPSPGSLNELNEDRRRQFLADMALLGDALLAVTDAYRVNYQILGNLEPYLHAHITPRYAWEPEEFRKGPTAHYDKSTGPFFDPVQHRPLMDKINAWLDRRTAADAGRSALGDATSSSTDRLIVTRSRLVADLRQLGVSAGQTVMLHASVKAIGWIVGGPDVVLDSLLDLLTPAGTLMMYVGWEEGPSDMSGWSEERKRAYRAECPPFDPRTSRAYRPWSILTEYLRTRPGAYRSANPEASCAAIGARAAWLTADHPMNYGYGPGSPLAKLCQVGGKVLLLGAPLNTVTLLHYSECLADVPDKRIVRYSQPILRDGKTTWVDVEEFDTSNGIRPYAGDYFNDIMNAYIGDARGKSGQVGAAGSFLFDAADLATFAASWMEQNLGSGGEH